MASKSSCAVESADVFTVFTDKSNGDSLLRTVLLGDGELDMAEPPIGAA